MSIGFRASAGADNASAASITVNKPAGTIESDLMVAIIFALGGSGQTVTPPSGWTEFSSSPQSPSADAWNLKLWAYYRVAGASEPASYQWTFGSTVSVAGVISSYVGTDTADPIDADAGNVDTDFDTTHAAPSVTVTCSMGWVVIALGVEGFNDLITQPSGHTQRQNQSNKLELCDTNSVVPTGVYSPGTWTIGQSKNKAAYTIALNGCDNGDENGDHSVLRGMNRGIMVGML